MAIDKLIPQYLNKDEDPRLLKEVEMSNALNIRVSTDDDGNQGVLKTSRAILQFYQLVLRTISPVQASTKFWVLYHRRRATASTSSFTTQTEITESINTVTTLTSTTKF